MAALKIVAALAALAGSPVSGTPFQTYIDEAAGRIGAPSGWIARVLTVESGGFPFARSPKGAMGLMQLMPGTWAEMRVRLGLGADPYDPRDNILAGALYLKLMHERFGYPGLFAAYNAGPERYAAYLAGKTRLPAETRAYVVKIDRSMAAVAMRAPSSATAAPSAAGLFFRLGSDAGR